MTTIQITHGMPARYIGPCMYPGKGAVGHVEFVSDYDLYCGEECGIALAFFDKSGEGYYCDPQDVEPI